MGFELPPSVESDIRRYAEAEHISLDEATLKLIREALKAARRKGKAGDLVTDEQLRQLKRLDPSFGLLADVPEEKIDQMAATIQRMKREGFGRRA